MVFAVQLDRFDDQVNGVDAVDLAGRALGFALGKPFPIRPRFIMWSLTWRFPLKQYIEMAKENCY